MNLARKVNIYHLYNLIRVEILESLTHKRRGKRIHTVKNNLKVVLGDKTGKRSSKRLGLSVEDQYLAE